MNKLPKKLLSVVLSVSLLLGCAPFAFAAGPTTFDVNNIKYEVTGENTVAVISNTGDDTQHSTYTGDITIPATVENDGTTYNVTEIGAIAFEQSAVTKVTLPTSITKIGNGAFYQCATVTEIVLNEGLLEIDAGAFNDCTSLATLTIPSTVTTLGRAAFGDCDALTALNIPKSVTSGVLEALADTNNEYPHLDAVTIEEGGTYSLQDGILYEGNDLVYRLDYTKTVIAVRDGVTEIPDYAFGSAGTIQGRPVVTSVDLPSSVTTIGEGAFQGADITSIDLTSVTNIGMNAFKGCDNLANVTWPTNLSTMGESAFDGCSALKNIEIAGSLTEIPDFAFNGCAGVESVVLPEGITRIGSYAFTLWDADYRNSNNLSYINIPDSVTSLGSVFLGGLESETKAALIFKRITLPTFEVEVDDEGTEYGALVGISPDMEMGTPTIYYPAEARSAYEESDDLEDLLPKDTNDNFVGAYGITPPALTSVKPMAADAEATDANKLTFTADVPTGAELTVSSSNNGIATVAAENGTITVTGVASGDATITATITLTGTDFVLTEKVIKVTVLEQDKEPAIVVPAEPETKTEVPAGTDSDLVSSIENALKPSEDSGSGTGSTGLVVEETKLAEAAETQAKDNTFSVSDGKTALESANIPTSTTGEGGTTEELPITIVVQPFISVTIKDVAQNETTSMLKLDITPRFKTVATTADVANGGEIVLVKKDGQDTPDVNAVVLDADKVDTNKLAVPDVLDVAIPLPQNFITATTAYVTHKKDSGAVYIYSANVDDNVLTFTTKHGFSEVTVTAENPAVAEITVGDETTYYPTFQAAVDAADANDTIKVLQDLGTVTVSGNKTFKVDANSKNINIVAAGGYVLTPGEDGIYTVATKPSSGGGSSSSGTYAVTVENSKHGTVTVSPKRADKGDTVTITVKPDKGYELDELVVLDKNGNEIKLTKTADNKYTFKMPASKVTVDAAFAVIDDAPTFPDVPADHPLFAEIEWAAENGYIGGYADGTFGPANAVTRQQVWMILARHAGYKPANMAEAKAWAVANGVSDGTNPGSAVTRQQLVTILYRYAATMGYDISDAADLTIFPDCGAVAAYAQAPMAWSVANGIVGGTTQGTLNPAGTATRAAFAKILYRFCALV